MEAKYFKKKGITVRVGTAKKAAEYSRKNFSEVGVPSDQKPVKATVKKD